jgi:hypothetical protein
MVTYLNFSRGTKPLYIQAQHLGEGASEIAH